MRWILLLILLLTLPALAEARPFIENKGFEQFPTLVGSAPTNWTWGGGAANISAYTTDKINGSYSLEVNESAPLTYNNTNFDSSWVGKSTEFVAYVKTNATNACKIRVHDGNGASGSSYAVGNDTWQKLTAIRNVTTGADRIEYNIDGANGVRCLFDEVSWGVVLNLSFDGGVSDFSTYNDTNILTDIGSQSHPSLGVGAGGAARSFNGSGAEVRTKRTTVFDFYGGDASGDMWVNGSSSCAGDKYLFSLRGAAGTDPGVSLFCETGNSNLNLELHNGTGSIYAATTGLNFGNGTKHWVYWEWDAYANQSRLYVDNVLRAFATHRGGFGADTFNLTIGGKNAANFWNITVDEFLIRSYRLTAEERTNRYTFLSDNTAPSITVQSPVNASYANTSVWVNVTLNEPGSTVIAQLNSSINYTLTNSSGNWNRLLTGLTKSAYNVTIFANDSNGNMATTTVYFNITPGFNLSVRVYRGWNLIAVPENTTLQGISNWTAAPTNITIVQCFNVLNQSWAKYNWTNGTGNSSYVCERGQAAFIFIGRNDTLNVSGVYNEWTHEDGGNWTTNRTIYVGYNYLAVLGNVSLVNASNWTSSFRFVSCWNASRQEFFTYMNRSIWAGGLYNTSVCIEGYGVVLYSLVNETILMKRGADPSLGPLFAAVLFLSAGAWLFRWFSRRGET